MNEVLNFAFVKTIGQCSGLKKKRNEAVGKLGVKPQVIIDKLFNERVKCNVIVCVSLTAYRAKIIVFVQAGAAVVTRVASSFLFYHALVRPNYQI